MAFLDENGVAVLWDLTKRNAEQKHWTLIDKIEYAGGGKYTTGSNGTFTWTAPDLFEGKAYEIGVYMIGGGSSGAAVTWNSYDGDQFQLFALGGASGYAKNMMMTVTPGSTYASVIGAGGAAVSTSLGGKNGNTGGSTSFNGVTVNGGGSPRFDGSYQNQINGADGGQGSSTPLAVNNGQDKFAGTITIHTPLNSRDGNSQSPAVSQNLFDQTMITLACGGFATTQVTSSPNNSNNSGNQTVGKLPDGTGGGSGSSAATGNNATGYGNGGGAVARYGTSAKSGAGSSGVVFIYAKGVVA